MICLNLLLMASTSTNNQSVINALAQTVSHIWVVDVLFNNDEEKKSPSRVSHVSEVTANCRPGFPWWKEIPDDLSLQLCNMIFTIPPRLFVRFWCVFYRIPLIKRSLRMICLCTWIRSENEITFIKFCRLCVKSKVQFFPEMFCDFRLCLLFTVESWCLLEWKVSQEVSIF